MTLQEVEKFVDDRGIEFFLCSFVEMGGAPKAKVVPATNLSAMAAEGAGFAGFAAGNMGQGPHENDMASIPDFRSITVVPWRPNMAWVAGDVVVDDAPFPYCPRTILKRQLQKAADRGYALSTGVEPEFMLLQRDEDGRYSPYDELDVLAKPCYDLVTLNRNLDIMTTLIKHMQEMGWNPYANDHEDANCQFEINWNFANALTTADRHTFFKWMVKVIAEEHGLYASFMPKPFADLTGNGAHHHLSLWQGDRNLFLDSAEENGLSQEAYWFMGGLLQHAKGMAAINGPLVNSYKRLVRGAPRSGATWAPVYITYGGSNRTQMVRIPGSGRIENRCVDGAANPYLAAAVMLAAGLDGIDQKMDPGTRNDNNLYEYSDTQLRQEDIDFLPSTLSEAVDHLADDAVLRAALGEEYAAYYIEVKREEWCAYHHSVSQWELDEYLPVH